MDRLTHPPPLGLNGNMSENWRRLRQQFDIYLTPSGIDKNKENVKAMTLLHVLGTDGMKIKIKNKLSNIILKFEIYCNPRNILTYKRYLFFARTQKTSENIDGYITDLRNKARTCEFGQLHD